jgi:catechol 2,3-dioxygenase-like lactoylglutathione lyase family enzyme
MSRAKLRAHQGGKYAGHPPRDGDCRRSLKNLSFYTRDLGLRFVKKTVNFDDPSTYHFYCGDETGRPGTILTFFPWTNASAGQRGAGETRQTAFRVPLRSIGYWTGRFIEKGMPLRAGAREGSASAPSPARR